MKRVTSRQNALVARYRAAARGDADGLILLDGIHLVTDALAAGVLIRHATLRADALDDPELRALAARLAAAGIEAVSASRPVMDALSALRSASAVVALADRPVVDEGRLYAGRAPLVVIADGIQDPGNLGAIVRVAEAGGATGVMAAGRSADPYGWKALRGSMGSALRLPTLRLEAADAALAGARRRGCRIIATAPRGGQSLFEVDLTRAAAVVIGGEGQGLAPSLLDAADQRVTIPMRPPVESLNAAVTAALVVYEARRQRMP